LTRYTDDATARLTRRLIRAEQMARQEQRARHLISMLPFSVPIRLIGRDEILASIEALLPTLSPCHLLITGVPGVGKTTFVQELLRRQIIAGYFDHLLWIDMPRSVTSIRQQITEALLHEGGTVNLRDYLLIYRVAVVVDGLDALDPTDLASLLRDVSAAVVYLINHDNIPVEGVEAHFPLPELDRQAATELVNGMLRLQHNPKIERIQWGDIAQVLYEHVGGNPLALKLAVSLWGKRDEAALDADIQQTFMRRIFTSLDKSEKRVWCGLTLYPYPTDVLPIEQMEALVRQGVAEESADQRYALISSARDFVQQQYENNNEVRGLVDQMIAALPNGIDAFEVKEQALATDFPPLVSSLRSTWLHDLWREGLRRGHWARWLAILEGTTEPELHIAYAVCLRHLADWEGARQIFYNVVVECGNTGRFGEQAQALVEWSVLARSQGNYSEAQGLIAQAKRFAQRSHDDELLRALILHEAQLLIDQGSGAEAQQLLAGLPETVRVLTLQSEAQLAQEQFVTCRSLAGRALALAEAQQDQVTEASLHTIIGRSYERQRAFDDAERYFANALTLFERLGDAFALARAQTNLAAVLIPLKRLVDADMLLERAEGVQARLGDQVGLSATRHNRTIAGTDFAR
ncbi:MAG TPA: AAA family ATPase, partial [Phototrophicaceae bacterium]|nr:AAA family ATPase [Phototrophicaceae bacterium]